MKNQWYCGVEGQQYGPFTWEQLRGMAAEGRIIAESFVRRDVDQQWFQAAQVPGLLPKAAGAKKNGAAGSGIGQAATAVRNSDSAVVAAVGGDPSKSSTAIKRSKKPTSHSSGNIPVGQAVAAAPVVVTAPPVGQPAFPIVTTQSMPATASAAASTTEPPLPAMKGTSPLLIVGILGGACALVASIGVGVLVWSLTRPAKTPEQKIADATEQEMRGALEQLAADLQKNPPTELDRGNVPNFQPLADEMQKALKEGLGKLPATGAAPASAPAAATPDAVAKVIKSIPATGWKDVTQLRGIELNKLKLSVASAWLAADESGKRVDPAAGSGKFVFVQLRVANVAPVVRKYKSWNVAGGTAVVLADQNNAVLNLIPSSATPAANRLSAVDIQPGQSVTDTLVFAAPGGAVEKLHLALAKSALAENVKFKSGSHFALEIPLEVLLAGGSSSDAGGGEAPIAATRAAPAGDDLPAGIIEPMNPANDRAAGTPAVVVAPTLGAKKEDRPPTRAELNKQFEELSKKEGQPEAKKGEAQK